MSYDLRRALSLGGSRPEGQHVEHGDALASLALAGEHVAVFRFGLVLVF